MAAVLGSRGGKASKRQPGRLRCILLEICNELGRQDNFAVFCYLQMYSTACDADNAYDDTCWFKHCLWADPQSSNDLGARYEIRGPNDDKPQPCVSRPFNSDYTYHFFDGEHDQTTDAHTIRSALYRIRCTDKRLSVIRAE